MAQKSTNFLDATALAISKQVASQVREFVGSIMQYRLVINL